LLALRFDRALRHFGHQPRRTWLRFNPQTLAGKFEPFAESAQSCRAADRIAYPFAFWRMAAAKSARVLRGG
jgi:hypothetical protein